VSPTDPLSPYSKNGVYFFPVKMVFKDKVNIRYIYTFCSLRYMCYISSDLKYKVYVYEAPKLG